MNHTRLWVVASILGGILLVSFALSAPHTHDIVDAGTVKGTVVATPSVALHDVFRKGVHTITGSIVAPNPCTTVTAQAVPVGDASSTTGILVEVALPEDTGVCLQVKTALAFSTSISAPAGIPISATVNGVTATTTAP